MSGMIVALARMNCWSVTNFCHSAIPVCNLLGDQIPVCRPQLDG